MSDHKMTRRSILKGAVGMAVGATVVGSILTPAQAAQPHMAAALSALQTAVSELQSAEADKGGHRDRAISICRNAIHQVQMGMAAGAGH